jgi:uncharacterized protein (DUF427 family)
MKAKFLGELVASTVDQAVIWLEGVAYFPPSSVATGALTPSAQVHTSPSKGPRQFFDVLVAGSRAPVAAWSYPAPMAAAVAEARADFGNYIAFNGAVIDLG